MGLAGSSPEFERVLSRAKEFLLKFQIAQEDSVSGIALLDGWQSFLIDIYPKSLLDRSRRVTREIPGRWPGVNGVSVLLNIAAYIGVEWGCNRCAAGWHALVARSATALLRTPKSVVALS